MAAPTQQILVNCYQIDCSTPLWYIQYAIHNKWNLPQQVPGAVEAMDLEAARARLMRQLAHEISDKKVLDVMGRVPRELFVPISSQHAAYENVPLPIDMGQTISQPLIVGVMTEALDLEGNEKVLEVGTGSGYQAAILAELARRVVSVERHQKLAEGARKVLSLLGYRNVEIHIAGEKIGWEKEAPYDAIIVTAGAPSVPPGLVDQLAVGGRLVIPVGTPFEQDLIKVIRHRDRTEHINLGPAVSFPSSARAAGKRNRRERVAPLRLMLTVLRDVYTVIYNSVALPSILTSP